jgi:hypothetical protein
MAELRGLSFRNLDPGTTRRGRIRTPAPSTHQDPTHLWPDQGPTACLLLMVPCQPEYRLCSCCKMVDTPLGHRVDRETQPMPIMFILTELRHRKALTSFPCVPAFLRELPQGPFPRIPTT